MIKLLETAKQTIAKIAEMAKSLKWRLKSQWHNKLNAIGKAIALSANEFSLIIALYKSKEQRDKWIEKLSHKYKRTLGFAVVMLSIPFLQCARR